MLGMSFPLPTSSSLILSSCSEWTAIAWKGSWWATVLSQGRTYRRYIGCANQALRAENVETSAHSARPPTSSTTLPALTFWCDLRLGGRLAWPWQYSFKYKFSARSIVPGCNIRRCFPFRHPFVCLFRGLWAVCRGHQPWWRRQGRSSRDHQRKR